MYVEIQVTLRAAQDAVCVQPVAALSVDAEPRQWSGNNEANRTLVLHKTKGDSLNQLIYSKYLKYESKI
jgi:hypothetical protein